MFLSPSTEIKAINKRYAKLSDSEYIFLVEMEHFLDKFGEKKNLIVR